VTDAWTDRLSEYVDGELDAREALDLEAHLATCAGCSEALAALRQVTARAAALGPREPARDLWPGIAARLAPRGAERPGLAAALAAALRSLLGRRLTLSVPQLAAVSLALILVSGGTAWIALGRRPAPRRAPPPVAAAPGGPAGATAVGVAQYDAAIAELERVLAQHRSDLDSSTVRVLEQNLAIIDRAIADARHALAADPTDPYLNDHLAGTMRRKMDLLRRVTEAVAYST
jgi:anti-sigma factor RsiW